MSAMCVSLVKEGVCVQIQGVVGYMNIQRIYIIFPTEWYVKIRCKLYFIVIKVIVPQQFMANRCLQDTWNFFPNSQK